mmetsp:Transcript_46414/g.110308  ORF Transcript_46414/g.110308 Transcript_46414/m.110308 type:complete len:207 (+) Transcript_46414:636-1256(+)
MHSRPAPADTRARQRTPFRGKQQPRHRAWLSEAGEMRPPAHRRGPLPPGMAAQRRPPRTPIQPAAPRARQSLTLLTLLTRHAGRDTRHGGCRALGGATGATCAMRVMGAMAVTLLPRAMAVTRPRPAAPLLHAPRAPEPRGLPSRRLTVNERACPHRRALHAPMRWRTRVPPPQARAAHLVGGPRSTRQRATALLRAAAACPPWRC